MFPAWMAGQGITATAKINIVRQDNGKVPFRHRDSTAIIAMDDRDRTAPIALARYAPVTKPVSCLASTSFGGGNCGNGGGFTSLDIKTIPSPLIKQLSGAGIGRVGYRKIGGVFAIRQYNW